MGVSASRIDYDSIQEASVTTSQPVIQVFSMSDIHGDSKSNASYLQNLEQPVKDSFTVFICNGDLCTDIATLRKSFHILKATYDEVCFVPGNHELWRRGTEEAGGVQKGNISYAPNSLSKFNEVIRCARQCGIRTGPLIVKSTHVSSSIRIYPLYSWYHSGFDTEKGLTNSLYLEYKRMVPFEMMWMDFRQCQWPASIVSHVDFINVDKDSTALATLFGSINDFFLPALAGGEANGVLKRCDQSPGEDITISFSHFVPRLELIPEKRFLLEPSLARVSGSDLLEAQIRQLKPDLHIFGHTHLPIDMTLDGIRYIQWPLGYGKEQAANCKESKSLGPLLLFDSSRQPPSLTTDPGSAPNGLLSDTAESPSFHSYWTRYYRDHRRTPDLTEELSPVLEHRLTSMLQIDSVL